MSMTEESILVIGASRAALDAASALSSEPWAVATINGLADLSGASGHHLIVLDTETVSEPPWRAMEILRDADPHAAILMLVTPGTTWASFASYRPRPTGLVQQPFKRQALVTAVDSALIYRKLLEENRSLKRQLGSAVSSDWVGCTEQSHGVRQSIATAAYATGSVALIGEGGSGRRLAAELVHRHGRNPGRAFLPMDLSSLPEGELGRILAEVPKSSDTASYWARGARPGTLYLRELNALGAEDQLALKEFVSEPLPFRLMVSAHPSIHATVRRGGFDATTFAAVSKLSIDVPSLRERRDDIPALIDHFLKRFCDRFELKPLGIPSSSIESYASYDWPGNVSELSMVIERAISTASVAKFDGGTLPERFCTHPEQTAPEAARLKNVSLRELIADIEKRIIVQTLARVHGSQRRAAGELRLNPTTLHEKMKRYNILRERHPPTT